MPRRYLFIYLLAVLLPVAACSSLPRVRSTLDQVLADPAAFKDSELIITAPVADVLERYALYRERRIEVTGTVAYYGRQSFWTWYIMLADREHTLRCYTGNYRLKTGRDAELMLLRALKERKPLAVNGVLRNDGIDILEIVYEGQVVRPDFYPPEAVFFPGLP